MTLSYWSRRQLLIGSSVVMAGALTGCNQTSGGGRSLSARTTSDYASMYGPVPKERFPLPAINLNKIPKKYLRREVFLSYQGKGGYAGG